MDRWKDVDGQIEGCADDPNLVAPSGAASCAADNVEYSDMEELASI